MADEIEKERGVVMDTPERTKIATPLSKFEDSPVFNYINSLSPIKPVKSLPITQTFTSLGFSSVPSVFTSPHVSSVKESRFLRRNQCSDPSKPDITSENSKNDGTNEGISNVIRTSSYECSNSEVGLSRTLSYEGVTLDTINAPEMADPSSSIARFIHERSTNEPSRKETEIKERDPIEQKEGSGCDWDSLISDTSELLNFDSFSDEMPYKSPDQNMIDPTSIMIDNHKPEDADVESGNLSEKGENMKEAAEEILASTYFNNNPANGDPPENIENEVGSNLCRGMRRRCLLFEMAGSRRKHLEESNASGEKRSNDSPRCILPGIGLHLNALAATTSLDHKVIKHEALCNGNGGQLIIAPSTTSLSMASGQESLKENAQNGVPVAEDASKALGLLANDDLNQSSPRKKRRRGEHGGEGEACKRCNCKKSKCLKLYCECFAAGVYCVEPCSCQECFNKPIHEDTVLATRKQIESRNPLAFAPKVIRTSEPILETGDESSKTPASARHKRGCNCKKSGCLKKYCECYQGGVGCSISCRCEGCKNAFGRKDGSEMDVEVNEEDECEGNKIVGSLQKNAIQIEAEPISAIPATPSRFGRQPIPLATMTSKSKPPRSFLPIGISNFQPPSKHEIPEILQPNNTSSSSIGVKSSSPNSKRVSPPHSSSPGGPKSTRKLILQSIPSFPSLTTHP